MSFNYAYALTYVKMDSENKDVMYFNNDSEKESYFNLSSLFSGELKKIDFDKRNLKNITLVVDSTGDDNTFNEFKYNYCIIKEISTSNYFFYFIDGIKYDNKQHILLSCKLDSFTTFRDKLNFNGTIKRATFREFLWDGVNNLVRYDYNNYTHILTIDDTFRGEKFLQYQKTLTPHIYTYKNDSIDEWIENNVECWQYIFIDKNHLYNYSKDGASHSYKYPYGFHSHGIYCDYAILCFPVMKTNKKIVIKFSDITDPNNPVIYNLFCDSNAIDFFREKNNDSTYIYSMKISKQPPFNPIISALSNFTFNYSYSTSGNLIFDVNDGVDSPINSLISVQPNNNAFITLLNSDNIGYFLFEFTGQINEKFNYDLTSLISPYLKNYFTRSDYLNFYKDFNKYPNVLVNKNVEIKITYNGDEYSINANRLKLDDVKLEMLESISPDVSKIYVNFKSPNTYIFKNAYNNTLTGYIFNDDTSLSIGNDYLAEFLANNKNFYMQRYINTAVKGGLNATKSYMNSGLSGAAISFINSGLDVANLLWEDENLENRKSSLKMANGNALFNNLVKEYGIKLEIWLLNSEDLTNIAEYYHKFGESSNTQGYLSDVMKKHKYFDYVEMDVNCIEIIDNNLKGISNEIKNDLITKLKRGVRFWYSNLYNFEKYNYEIALEE